MSLSSRPITTRNARFQQWQAMLANRTKRQRLGGFLVQGVRPITIALDQGWQAAAILMDGDRELSSWAQGVIDGVDATAYALSRELMAELGEKSEDAPELILEMVMPPDDLSRIRVTPDFLGVVFDRPTSPGNLGSVIRSADALGAAGVVVTGHAADPYDSAAVRASTGSLFAVPTVRISSPRDVVAWVQSRREDGIALQILGTDENGQAEVFDADLTGPTLLVIGNETTGLSTTWREAVDLLIGIPMSGSASSLNAANAASIVLYEATRQRLRP